MGICNRSGSGRLRRIDTHALWIHQVVRRGGVELRKVKGQSNAVDLLTNPLPSRDRIIHLCKLFACDLRTGRPKAAPRLRDAPAEVLNCTRSKALISHASSNKNERREDGQRLLAGDLVGHRVRLTHCDNSMGYSVLPHQRTYRHIW